MRVVDVVVLTKFLLLLRLLLTSHDNERMLTTLTLNACRQLLHFLPPGTKRHLSEHTDGRTNEQMTDERTNGLTKEQMYQPVDECLYSQPFVAMLAELEAKNIIVVALRERAASVGTTFVFGNVRN